MTEPGCDPIEVVDIDFDSGGSGQGVTWHNTASSCPRRHRLQTQARQRAQVSDTPYQRNWEAMYDADKGTVFHKLAELYHGRNVPNPEAALRVPEPGAKPAFDEGIRLYEEYRRHFSADYWGKVIGGEVRLPVPGADVDILERITAKLGYPLPVTIDLVADLSQSDVNRIEEDCKDCGLALNGPGVYLVDHKTKKQRPNFSQYRAAVQGKAYQIVYNALNPGNECRGMIYNFVVAHKELRRRDLTKNKQSSFLQLYTKPPTSLDIARIGSWILSTRALAQTDFQNLSQCGFCPYNRDGELTCD